MLIIWHIILIVKCANYCTCKDTKTVYIIFIVEGFHASCLLFLELNWTNKLPPLLEMNSWYREIRSYFCIHTFSDICWTILRVIWPCWYAFMVHVCVLKIHFFTFLRLFACLIAGSVGLSFLQFTNMNSMRNLFITGLSLFLGISIPQFFSEYWNGRHGLVHTHAGWVSFYPTT